MATDNTPKPGFRAWYMLAVLVVVYTISFVDRQILSILAETIKLDLKLDDAQLGFLYGTAFAIFYALFGIPLGRLADSWNRVWLIALGLVAWSVMTAFSGFATTFALLAIARVGVGVGEASTSPAAYSLIADHFPEKQRSTALSIYATGLYIGMGLSLPVGGFILSHWTNAFPDPASAPLGLSAWQATFVAVGLPGALLALIVLTLQEPRTRLGAIAARPWADFGRELVAIIPPFTLWSTARIPGALKWNLMVLAIVAAIVFGLGKLVGDAPQWIAYGVGIYAVFSWVQSLRVRDAPTYRLIWATPVTLMLVIAFGSIAFITYATSFWASPYALRTFYAGGPTSPAHLLSGLMAAEEVSSLVGWSSAVASALGVIIGGMIADRWRTRHVCGRLYTVAASILLSAPLVFMMFSTRDLRLFFILTPLATFVSSSWTGAAIATIQGLVLPRMRATAGATFLLGMTLVGLALGPYVAGKVGALTGGLRNGIFVLYVVAPFTLLAIWRACTKLAQLEASREERAGERIETAA